MNNSCCSRRHVFLKNLFNWNPPAKSLSATVPTENTEQIKQTKPYSTSFASDCQKAVSSEVLFSFTLNNGAECMTTALWDKSKKTNYFTASWIKDWEVISSENEKFSQYKIPKFQKLNVTRLKSYYMRTDFQLCLRGKHHRVYHLKSNHTKDFLLVHCLLLSPANSLVMHLRVFCCWGLETGRESPRGQKPCTLLLNAGSDIPLNSF